MHMQELVRMQFTIQCKIMATVMLALGSGHLVAAGRSLLQDAPTGVIMCDVAIVGGGPGEGFSLAYHPSRLQILCVCLVWTTCRVIADGARQHAYEVV